MEATGTQQGPPSRRRRCTLQSPKPPLFKRSRNYIDLVSSNEMKKQANIIRQSRLALHVAAHVGDERVARQLLMGGWQIDAKDVTGQTPLHRAARKDNHGVARVLVEARANMYQMNNEGLRPLHVAAEHGCLQVAKLLIERKVGVDADSAYGETPLHFAARAGQMKVVKYLMAAKASLFRSNCNGNSPIDIANGNARKLMALVAKAEHGHRIRAYPTITVGLNDGKGRAPYRRHPPTPPTPPLTPPPSTESETQDTEGASPGGGSSGKTERSSSFSIKRMTSQKKTELSEVITKPKVVAGTRRRDGSFRKAVRIRPGFQSEEDIRLEEERRAERMQARIRKRIQAKLAKLKETSSSNKNV